MTRDSRLGRAARQYSSAPRSVSLGEFELVATRSALNASLLPPSMVLRHVCGWEEPLGERVNGGEVAALAAAHGQLGCDDERS